MTMAQLTPGLLNKHNCALYQRRFEVKITKFDSYPFVTSMIHIITSLRLQIKKSTQGNDGFIKSTI